MSDVMPAGDQLAFMSQCCDLLQPSDIALLKTHQLTAKTLASGAITVSDLVAIGLTLGAAAQLIEKVPLLPSLLRKQRRRARGRSSPLTHSSEAPAPLDIFYDRSYALLAVSFATELDRLHREGIIVPTAHGKSWREMIHELLMVNDRDTHEVRADGGHASIASSASSSASSLRHDGSGASADNSVPFEHISASGMHLEQAITAADLDGSRSLDEREVGQYFFGKPVGSNVDDAAAGFDGVSSIAGDAAGSAPSAAPAAPAKRAQTLLRLDRKNGLALLKCINLAHAVSASDDALSTAERDDSNGIAVAASPAAESATLRRHLGASFSARPSDGDDMREAHWGIRCVDYNATDLKITGSSGVERAATTQDSIDIAQAIDQNVLAEFLTQLRQSAVDAGELDEAAAGVAGEGAAAEGGSAADVAGGAAGEEALLFANFILRSLVAKVILTRQGNNNSAVDDGDGNDAMFARAKALCALADGALDAAVAKLGDSAVATERTEGARFFFGGRSAKTETRWVHMQGGVHRLTALKLCLKYSFHPTSLEDIFEFQNTLGCRPKVEKHEGPNKVPHFFFIIPFVMAHGGDNVAEIRAHEVMLGIAHQRRRASKCCDPEGVVLGLKRWCWLPTSFRDRVINFTLRALTICCKRLCGPKAMKAALAMDSGSADAGWYQRLRKQKALYEERGRRVRSKLFLFLQSSIESIP